MSNGLAGVKVLVVEDDEDLRDALVATLEGLGAGVVGASDGDDAWARLQAGPFDVVVTDVRMPGADGLELIRRLGPRPVVVISGHADPLVQRPPAWGPHRFLAKPFTTDSLVDAIVAARAAG